MPQDGDFCPFCSFPGPSCSHLFHDGILRVFALHDAGIDEIPDAVVAAASRQDGEVGRLLSVLEPSLDPCKRLGEKEIITEKEVWIWGLKGVLGNPFQGYAALPV